MHRLVQAVMSTDILLSLLAKRINFQSRPNVRDFLEMLRALPLSDGQANVVDMVLHGTTISGLTSAHMFVSCLSSGVTTSWNEIR